MPSLVRAITRIQDADDAPSLGSGQDGFALVWDNATARFVATKTFTNGIIAPTIDGSIVANGDITIQGTTHATRASSYVLLQPNGGLVGIGLAAPVHPLGIISSSGYPIGLYGSDASLQGEILANGLSTTRSVGFNLLSTSGNTGDNWVTFRFNGASNKLYIGDSGTNTYISSHTGHPLYLSAGVAATLPATPHIALLTTGSVGIGIAVPNGKLDVAGSLILSGSLSNSLALNSFATIAANYLLAGKDGYWGIRQGTAQDINIDVYSSGAQKTALTILQSGYIGFAQATPTAALDLPAGTTARAPLRIRTGVAPTSPNDGDIWQDGTSLFVRINGVTKTVTLT